MPSFEQLVSAQLGTFIAFGAIIVFALFELAVPRMKTRPSWRVHLPPVLGFAALTIVTTLVLQFAAQAPLVSAFVPLRVLNIGRLPWPAPVISSSASCWSTSSPMSSIGSATWCRCFGGCTQSITQTSM
jgi:hypothetical protein